MLLDCAAKIYLNLQFLKCLSSSFVILRVGQVHYKKSKAEDNVHHFILLLFSLPTLLRCFVSNGWGYFLLTGMFVYRIRMVHYWRENDESYFHRSVLSHSVFAKVRILLRGIRWITGYLHSKNPVAMQLYFFTIATFLK